eukprot:4942686-Pyramimonas_sp.AAC.1
MHRELSHNSSEGPREVAVSDPRPTTRSSRRAATCLRPNMLMIFRWPALRTPLTNEYIKQLRPIQHPELTGADAGAQASKMVADMCVSLRGALAHALSTQVWLMVYVVSLQRVQEPTNIHD